MFGTKQEGIGVLVVDDKVNFCQQEAILGFCKNSSYKFGHGASSVHHQDLSRFVSYLTLEELAVTGLDTVVHELAKELFQKEFKLDRAYINVYFPGTPTAVHTDDVYDNSVTLLYYANILWHHDWGGETQFFTRDMRSIGESVLPHPGRIALFDGTIPHTARSPSVLATSPRFTVTLKGKLE